MASPALHFRADVASPRDAAELLAARGPREFITWQAAPTVFMLSYNSVTFGRPEHLKIHRHADGTWTAAEGLEKRRYPSLGELLASRHYLKLDGSASATSSSAAASGVAGASSEGGLHRRGGGDASALPAHLVAPPSLEEEAAAEGGLPGLRDPAITVIPGVEPTCGPRRLPALLWLLAALGAGLTAAAWRLGAAHRLEVAAHAAEVRSALKAATVSARSAVAPHLEAAAAASAASDATALSSACAAAGQAWVGVLAPAAAEAEAALLGTTVAGVASAPATLTPAATYAGSLATLLFGACLPLLTLVLCLRTGRARVTKLRSDATEEEAAAYMAASAAEGPTPPCTPMQARWAVAFFACLAAVAVPGFLLAEAGWGYSQGVSAVARAAIPFATTPAKRGPAPAPGSLAAQRAAAAAVVSTARGSRAWNDGESAAVYKAFDLPEGPCAAAVAPYIAGLLPVPHIFRVPLDALLPAPLPHVLVHGVAPLFAGGSDDGGFAAHPHAAASPSLDASAALPPGLPPVFTIAHGDPFAGWPSWTGLRGWLDGHALMVPTSEALASAVVAWLGVLLAYCFAVLVACEKLGGAIDACSSAAARGAAARGRGGAAAAKKGGAAAGPRSVDELAARKVL